MMAGGVKQDKPKKIDVGVTCAERNIKVKGEEGSYLFIYFCLAKWYLQVDGVKADAARLRGKTHPRRALVFGSEGLSRDEVTSGLPKSVMTTRRVPSKPS